MRRVAQILFAIGTLGSLAAVGFVLSGRLDGLSNDGVASAQTAYLSIGIYWVIGSLVCWALAVWKRRWRQLLMMGVSICLCLILLEFGLRIVRPELALREFEFLRSNTHHHVLLPDSAYDLGRFEGRDVKVETNGDRLRTHYTVESFKAHSERLICLGDSFTFGAWVDGEDAYPALLETVLRDQGLDVAVLNAGMLSYSPLLHEQLLKHTLLKYKPTVVTLMLDCTDIGDDYHYGTGFNPSDPQARFDGPVLTSAAPHWGALWRLAKPLHPAILAPMKLAQRLDSKFEPHDPLDYYKFEIPVAGSIERDRFFIYRHPLKSTRPHFEYTFSRIEAIAELCKENDIVFVLFVAPRYHHWSDRESPQNWEAATYGDYARHQGVIFKFFAEKMGKAEFPIVNMLPAFQETTEYPLVFETDPHWNERGNRFVAKVVAIELLLRQVLRKPTSEESQQ